MVGYGFEGALKFGFYETFKIIFKNVTPYKVANFLLASVIAGAVASVVLCPMEEARIKMVGEASWAKENVVSAIARLVRESGLFASFAGLSAMLSKQVFLQYDIFNNKEEKYYSQLSSFALDSIYNGQTSFLRSVYQIILFPCLESIF